jgi:hypothetical protein
METSSAGLGTKNDCAGEGHQQFTRYDILIVSRLRLGRQKNIIMVLRGPEPRMTVLARATSNLPDTTVS